MRINTRKYETSWKDYFAWWPKRIDGTNIAWMETIQRRWKRNENEYYDKWVYRFK